MYFHVGPYTPYFGFGYMGMGSALIMWPPISNPLTNPITPPKPILRIAQAGIVINCEEQMRMMIILKENITLGCHKSFLLKNCTMNKGANHP